MISLTHVSTCRASEEFVCSIRGVSSLHSSSFFLYLPPFLPSFLGGKGTSGDLQRGRFVRKLRSVGGAPPRLTDGNRAEGIGREIEGEELLTSVEKNGGGKDYRSHRTSFTQGVPKEGMEQDPEMYLSSEGAGSGRKRIVLLVVSTKTNGLTSCITTANPKTP